MKWRTVVPDRTKRNPLVVRAVRSNENPLCLGDQIKFAQGLVDTRMQKAFIEHDLKRYRYDEGQIDHSAVKTNN